MSDAILFFGFGFFGMAVVWLVIVRVFHDHDDPIPGPRIKITPELRDRAVATQKEEGP